MTGLLEELEQYLTLRRSLGFKLESQEKRLRSFVRFMKARNEPRITGKLAAAWAGSQCGPATWSSRMSTVRAFARHVAVTDVTTEIPLRAVSRRSEGHAPTSTLTPRSPIFSRPC